MGEESSSELGISVVSSSEDRPLPGGGVIHEVTNSEINTEPLYEQFLSDLGAVQRVRLSPTDKEAAELLLFKNLGSAGEDLVHSILPDIKKSLIDDVSLETVWRGIESRDAMEFALIHNAAAEVGNVDDTMMAIEALGSKNLHLPGQFEASQQICFNLIREIDEIKRIDPENPAIQTIAARLKEIRNNAHANKSIRDYTILLPLAVAGDPEAIKHIRPRGDIEDHWQIAQHINQRYNLATQRFEPIVKGDVVDSESGKILSREEAEELLQSSLSQTRAQLSQKAEQVETQPGVGEFVRPQRETSKEDKVKIDDVIRRYKMHFGDQDQSFIGKYVDKREKELDREAASIVDKIGEDALPYLKDQLSKNPNLLGAQKYKLAQYVSGLSGMDDTPDVVDLLTTPFMTPIDSMHSYMANHELAGVIHRNILALRLFDPEDPRLEQFSRYIVGALDHRRTVPIVRNELIYALAMSGTKTAEEFYDRDKFKDAEFSTRCAKILHNPEEAFSLAKTADSHQQVFLTEYDFNAQETKSLSREDLATLLAPPIEQRAA